MRGDRSARVSGGLVTGKPAKTGVKIERDTLKAHKAAPELRKKAEKLGSNEQHGGGWGDKIRFGGRRQTMHHSI